MFVIIERKYEWYEKDMWSDPCLDVKERVMDIAGYDGNLIDKYIKKGEWEKIEDEYDTKLIKRYKKYDDHGNKVERIIVGIGDEFIEEVY